MKISTSLVVAPSPRNKASSILATEGKDTKKQLPLPNEFKIYEDKAIQGWLHKQCKGYFSSWKRLYVTVDNKKLCYYQDSTQSAIKGLVDFSTIRAHLEVLNEKTF